MNAVKLFAVTGRPILHSLSPRLFQAGFDQLDLPFIYTRVRAESSSELLSLVQSLQLSGFNVTSPFKQDLVDGLDCLDAEARQLLAVNAVVFNGANSIGYNLDGFGVKALLARAKFDPKGQRVAVLGAGGAARSAAQTLKNEGALVVLVNRTQDSGQAASRSLKVEFCLLDRARDTIRNSQAVVVCWPQGVQPFDPGWLNPGTIIFDANYHGSFFAGLARETSCPYYDGKEWLLGQALAGFRLFTGLPAPQEAMRKALSEKASSFLGPVVLVGMMGSGKSAVGAKLADLLSRKFIDTDARIEARYGRSIPEIFQQEGETVFRKYEENEVEKALAVSNSVISLGGGALLNEDSFRRITAGGTVVWLWADPEVCATRITPGSRPLLAESTSVGKLRELLDARFIRYARSADMIIDANHRDPSRIAGAIADEVHLPR